MKSFILCRRHFSDAYVERIRAAAAAAGVGRIHCIVTTADVDASKQPPNVLVVLGGSETQQRTQTVRARFGGGAAAGAFEIALAELPAFFEGLLGSGGSGSGLEKLEEPVF